MSASDFIALIDSGGGWIALAYIFFTAVLPKIAPAYAKAINKNQTREDRLFTLIADTNTQNAKLAAALDGLAQATKEHNMRLEKLEDTLRNCHK